MIIYINNILGKNKILIIQIFYFERKIIIHYHINISITKIIRYKNKE